MTISPSAIVPEVLKKDNYERWRILMQHHFVAQDLWDVITSDKIWDVVTSDKIPERVNEEREWTKKNASALLAIKISCEGKVFDEIKKKKSAKEAWDALAVMHQKDVSQEIVEHRAVTIGRQRIAEDLIFSARETEDLEIQYNRDSDVKKLFEACNRGDKRATRILYRQTPLDKLTTEIRFKLLEECITKKMFDIAFDLFQKFPELTDPLSCPLGSVPIILTLAQITPPFFRESQFIFWKRWIYKCTRVKADSIKQIKDEKFLSLDLDVNDLVFIIFVACCPWLLLLRILLWIYREWVPNSYPQSLAVPQQSLGCARKILQQSLVILQQSLRGAQKILQQSLASLRKVTHQSCVEFRATRLVLSNTGGIHAVGTLKGVSLGMLKMLCVLLWELTVMPFIILTVVVALPPISVRTLIFGRKLFVPGLQKEFGCTFIADVLSKLVSLLSWAFVRQVYDQKTMDEYARKVITLICEPLSKLDQNQFEQSVAVEAIFQAIKNGITEIINEIEKAFGNILWSRTDPKGSGNMFACAVAHRQEKVAQIIYGRMDTNLLIKTDEDGNNALHIAAKLAPHSQLGCISGAALQLQSEVRWFKSAERIIPRFCNECKNEDGETPFQVFAKEHKILLKEAEEWMKKTAESSTVVGALIITIMFAVAFTVPGGNEQNSGYPIFLPKKPIPFTVFIVSDAISLFTASSSVLMFLGILTSRYDYEDFLKSLPIKLIIGISSLFISIATMTTAFCAALFIMLQGRLEVVIPITLFGSIPIAFFGWLQFPLLVEICASTFRRDIFQKEKKSFLEEWFQLFCGITVEFPMDILK